MIEPQQKIKEEKRKKPQSTFRLFPEILMLSEADDWQDAALEWKLVGIQWDKKGDHCICGHFIKEKCFIKNIVNGNHTIVGNCCITKFKGEDLTSVFRALSQNKVNAALIGYAYEEGIINEWELDFMLKLWRKRKLTWKQRNKFNEIKAKIYKACKMEILE